MGTQRGGSGSRVKWGKYIQLFDVHLLGLVPESYDEMRYKAKGEDSLSGLSLFCCKTEVNAQYHSHRKFQLLGV